ncbi:MAG: S-layer protein [Methanomicrobiales archaeon]|nr:S-layer protein [Methanomicrobiales archaeon]
MAGTRVLSGSPALSATVFGANEFSPGTETIIPVVIQNSGLIEFEFTYPTTLTPADLPNTAKLMTVTLTPGEAPVTILSDPQMVGDLMGGARTMVNFKARIGPDAPAGTYTLPLMVHYTYLAHADQYGQDSLQYYYKTKDVTLDLPIQIKPEITLGVVSVDTGNITVGTEGFVTVQLQNRGHEDGTDAVLTLTPAQNSPVIPTVGSVYIGDFPAGSTATIPFKVAVSASGEAQTYPMDLAVQYKDETGNFVSSDAVVIGIPVSGKISFDVVSSPPEVTPGGQHQLTIEYRNTGSAPVYSAQARIYTVDPFTTGDDTSYLGPMAPGESSTAVFEVTVDSSATVKTYSLDSEIRYRDALDNDQISDRITVPVSVIAPTGFQAVLAHPGFIAAVVLGAGVLVIVWRLRWKKRRS